MTFSLIFGMHFVALLVAIICLLGQAVAFVPVQTGALFAQRAKTEQFLFGGDNSKPAKGGDGKKDGGGLLGGMGNMMDAMKKAQVRIRS